MSKKIVLLGASGQLGQSLAASRLGESHTLHTPGRDLIDLYSEDSITRGLDRIRPDLIINAAAFTGVDAAQRQGKEAFALNEQAVQTMATWGRDNGARLIHISTDFVFDGKSNRPYRVEDPCGPINIYGQSKFAGEQELRVLMPERSTIIRTAWLYSPFGGNFVKTMLRLMQEKPALSVVADQVGTPCSTASLTRLVLALIEALESRPVGALYHWTDAGVASWYDFAVAIQEEALALGLLEREIPIHPVATEDYPTPARRPAYSVLDKSRALQDLGIEPRHWRVELRDVLEALKAGS